MKYIRSTHSTRKSLSGTYI